MVSGVRRINEVNARRARLVPGWVTVFGRVYRFSVCHQPTRSTQPCIPPGSLDRVPASAGAKAGMSPGISQNFEFRGLKAMASAEREPITGVWGQSPQRGPGAEPLVGVRGAKPPEAERVLAVGRPVEAANFPHSMHF